MDVNLNDLLSEPESAPTPAAPRQRYSAMSLDTFLARQGAIWTDTTLWKVLAGLPSLTPQGPWLAGGALRRTVLGEEPASDFDFFFANEAQLSAFAHALTANGASLLNESNHHQTYRMAVAEATRTIQLICFRYYESAQAVVDSFDYTICQFAFDGLTLTMGEWSLWDLARKRLVLYRLSYPVSSLRRLLKYQKHGYYACAGCLTSLMQETVTNSELHAQLDVQYVD